MDFFFADDARQPRPSRDGMDHALVATGAICVPDDALYPLERGLQRITEETGFPPGEEFKWSPGRELWMREELRGRYRFRFFADVLVLASQLGVKAIVVVEDVGFAKANAGVESHELDVTTMLLERVNAQLTEWGTYGIVVTDRPSGDRARESSFLTSCLETLQTGTDFVQFDRIAINVLASPSKLVRVLQLADVVTGCTTAYVSGENTHSPALFPLIKSMFRSGPHGEIGGFGLKLHPDLLYLNLYHWLLGDERYWRRGAGFALPRRANPYFFAGDRMSNIPSSVDA